VRTRTITAGVLVLAAAVTLVAATTAPASSTAKAKAKAAIITDIGGLGDKGFNDLCAKGLADAKKAGIATGRVFISKSAADYIPNLSTAARQGYSPIVVCGFLMGGDIEKAANRFPKTNFAIIDYSNTWMKSRPKNLQGALFAGRRPATWPASPPRRPPRAASAPSAARPSRPSSPSSRATERGSRTRTPR
jgi:basic membrane protein A